MKNLTRGPARNKRSGVALPIILIALLILGSMGVAFMGAGQSGYRFTAMSASRLRLDQLLMAAQDEARYRVFQQTTTLNVLTGRSQLQPELRAQLIELLAQNGGDPSTIELDVDITPLLPATRAVAMAAAQAAAGKQIDTFQARARFYGFRVLMSSDDGSFPNLGDYYSNVRPFEDNPNLTYIADFQGYCTVTVAVGSGNLRRALSSTHDVKIVNTAPPANEFAMFAWRSPAGLDERVFDALNEGNGRMALYPQTVGRVHIKGPYVFLVEGAANGLGGGEPIWNPSNPSPDRKWHGWGQVPLQRGLRLEYGRFFARSPSRPEQRCRDRSGFAATLGPGFGPTWTGDRAIFATKQPYLAAGVPLGNQKFFLNGEPHAQDPDNELNRIQGLGPDAWRGLLIGPNPEATEGSEQTLVSEEFVTDQGWENVGEEGQYICVEPGCGTAGLWSPMKLYQFSNDGCPRDGIIANVAGAVKTVIGLAVDILGFGILELRSYKRKPEREDEGVPSPANRSDLEELAAKAPGPNREEVEEEADVYLMPFGMYYESDATLSALSSFLNLGANVVGLALTVTGVGAAFAGPAKAGIQGLASASGNVFSRFAATTAGRVAIGAGTAGEIGLVGASVFTPQQSGPGGGYVMIDGVESTPGTTGTSATLGPDGQPLPTSDDIQSVSDQDPRDADAQDDRVDLTTDYSFNNVNRRTDWQRYYQQIQGGEDALFELMTGDRLGQPKNVTPASFDSWREIEAYDPPNNAGENQPLVDRVGYLPPRLKPYMRLATRVYDDLQEATGDGSRPLELEGVIAVERLPQAGENYTQNLEYVGRGVVFSGSRGGADDPNREPVLGGSVAAQNRGRDYMTMVYWSGADPKEATQGGVGMLGLTQSRNEGSFVSPYGVRPMGEFTGIRGNLVTGLIDRHRFGADNHLRVFYDWEVLAPEAAERLGATNVPQDEAGRWIGVSVSPKVCGWYDAFQ